jgi:hypothetical protein
MRTFSRVLALGIAAGAAALAGILVPTASADSAWETVSAESPPYAVETFDYPQADEILAEHGITLKRGDGHIIFTGVVANSSQCSGPANIAIESFKGIACFETNADSGFLTMEMPDTYGIWTHGHPVEATLTAENTETVVNVPQDHYEPVGISGDTGQRSVLVELRVTG